MRVLPVFERVQVCFCTRTSLWFGPLLNVDWGINTRSDKTEFKLLLGPATVQDHPAPKCMRPRTQIPRSPSGNIASPYSVTGCTKLVCVDLFFETEKSNIAKQILKMVAPQTPIYQNPHFQNIDKPWTFEIRGNPRNLMKT